MKAPQITAGGGGGGLSGGGGGRTGRSGGGGGVEWGRSGGGGGQDGEEEGGGGYSTKSRGSKMSANADLITVYVQGKTINNFVFIIIHVWHIIGGGGGE